MLSPFRVTRCAAALSLLISLSLVSGRDRSRVSAEKLLDDIRRLSSTAFGGRATGSPGLSKAADYIASRFSQASIRSLNDSGYLQPFPVTTGAKAGPNNSLRWLQAGKTSELQMGKDFEPFAFSANGYVGGQLAFAGYGITACEYGYDDYASIDVKGKVVVMLRHEPQEYEASSSFEGRVYTEHSQLFRKLLNARAHGAAAVLFVNDTANHSGPDNLEKMSSLPSPGGASIPFTGIRSGVVEQWFREAAGRSFEDAQKEIDRKLEPQSFAFAGDLSVELRTDVDAETRIASNVIAWLPGYTSEYVIVGAHYDHLGLGEQYSLAANTTGVIHPGADDNASGTSGVLAVARLLAEQPKARRGVLFVTFAGEEIGLLGSTWLTSHPVLPLRDAIAMLNMDMIGRLRDNTLTVGGTQSGEGLRATVEAAAKRFPLVLQMDGQALYGSSDHTAFTSHGVPALFFFTGLHADYHRPADTVEKVDARNTALVTDLVAAVTAFLTASPERPKFRYTAAGSNCFPEKIAHTDGGSGR